ncbi:MAG: hypothetical protein H6736_08725 [Alphaproteobacteria bacterium]|nr:hypothetical protein [Alphaproteobacteria bacterium]MCB9691885.1 hypothetical protein [Alphaproteobacteria bacterium]
MSGLLLATMVARAGPVVYPVDAWRFSHAVPDVATRRYLRGRLYTARTWMTVGMAAGTLGAVYGVSLTGVIGTRRTVPVGLFGLGLAVVSPMAYYAYKWRIVSPRRYWTAEEADAWRVGHVTPGLRVVPDGGGVAVLNRAGRPLEPLEIALRVGDRTRVRRLRSQDRVATLMGHGLAGLGGVLVGTGVSRAIASDHVDRSVVAGAMVGTGAVLVPLGLVMRARLRPHDPLDVWTRSELDWLVEHAR